MAITTVTLSKPPGLPGPQYMYEFYPRTENARVTVAAENYEETGPWTAVDAITDGSWSIELPTGTDQGGDLLPWYVVETPLTKVPGRGLKPAIIGDFYITSTSTSWAELIAGLIPTTATADPSTTFGTYVTEAQSARDAAQAAAGVWQPSTAYSAGAVAQAPDGSRIKRTTSGISRATFDATEQAAWTAVLATSGTVEQTAIKGAYASQSAFGVDAKVQGAKGDGTTDDTAALHAARDAAASFGAPVFVPAGTYLVDGTLNLNQPGQRWTLHDKATIKLKDGAAGASTKPAVTISANDVHLVGGVVDGNRSGQNKTTYNAAGGTPVAAKGIVAAGSPSTPITGLVVDTTVTNAIDMALHFTWVQKSSAKITVVGGGRGPSFQSCSDLHVDVTCRSLDNDGWKVLPHVLDLFFAQRVNVTLDSTDHYGVGTIAAGNSLDDWISGVTFSDVEDVQINGMRVETRSGNGLTAGVGVSLLSVRRMRATNVAITGYNDVALELGGVTDSQIDGLLIDGRYQLPLSSGTGRGVAAYNNGFAANTFTNRTTRYTENLVVTNFLIRRCIGDGIDLWAARNTHWLAGRVVGNMRGLRSEYHPTSFTDGVPMGAARDLRGHRFIGVDFSYNELHGVDLQDMSRSSFIGCSANNNGQASIFGTTRRSVAAETTPVGFATRATVTSGLSKTDLEFNGCTARDTQGWTSTLGPTPANPAVLAVTDDSLYAPGQSIRLVGAGAAGADLVTRIQSVAMDEITVATAPTTLATPAGTGTISTSGTTITGSGTAFTTELTARYWITAGGNTRRIAKVASDTSATLDAAFPSNLAAGTTFTIYRTAVQGIPSQQYGLDLSADTVSPSVIGGSFATNVTGSIRNSTATEVDRFALSNPSEPLAAGQQTMGWMHCSTTGVSPGASGDVLLHYFTATRAETVTQISMTTGGTAAGATPTLCRYGLYEIAANGDATLLASTTSDTAMFAAAFTEYAKPLSASVTLVTGKRYAVGLIIVSAAALPSFYGVIGPASRAAKSPIKCKRITGQSNLPSTVSNATGTGYQRLMYAEILP